MRPSAMRIAASDTRVTRVDAGRRRVTNVSIAAAVGMAAIIPRCNGLQSWNSADTVALSENFEPQKTQRFAEIAEKGKSDYHVGHGGARRNRPPVKTSSVLTGRTGVSVPHESATRRST